MSFWDLPGFINIQTVRNLWHSGTGIDGPPEWDRYQLVRSEMVRLGLQAEIEKIEKETTLQAEKIWKKQLQTQSGK